MSRDRPETRYIAIDGPPGSGVSAVARAVARTTGAVLYADSAADNPFREQFARHPARVAFQTQTFCLLARYRQQVELSQPELFSPRGAVSDYTFARDALFARVILSPDEHVLYERIHGLLDQRLRAPDLLVYLTADRDVLRSRLRRLVPSPDRVIKLNVIDQLADAMDDYVLSYAGGPVLVMNTSELDVVERPEHLEEFAHVIKNTRAGVRHVRPLSVPLL